MKKEEQEEQEEQQDPLLNQQTATEKEVQRSLKLEMSQRSGLK